MEYQTLTEALNEYARNLAKTINREYRDSLGEKNDLFLNDLSMTDFVVIEQMDEKTKILFQESIPLVSNKVPSIEQIQHIGGFVVLKEMISRHEKYPIDNKIHFFVCHKDCIGKRQTELINIFTELLPYQIFRFLIEKEETLNALETEVSSYLFEGLIKIYAKDFSKKYNIPIAKNTKNTSFASEILREIPAEIDKNKMVFQTNFAYIKEMYYIKTNKDLILKYQEEYLKEKDYEKVKGFLKKYFHLKDEELLYTIEQYQEWGSYASISKEITNRLLEIYKQNTIMLATSMEDLASLFEEKEVLKRNINQVNGYFKIWFILASCVATTVVLFYLLK